MQILEGKSTKAADPGLLVYFLALPRAALLRAQDLTGEKRLRQVTDGLQSAEDPGNVKYSH